MLLWDLTARPRGGALTPGRLGAYWEVLRGDGAAAQRAVRELAASPREAVPFLAERLKPAAPADDTHVARLIAGLDAAAFGEREKAAAALRELGDVALPALRKTLGGKPTPEVRRRVERLVEAIEDSPEWLRTRRALQALEYAGTPEALGVLERLAGGAPGARLTAEAKSAAARLGAR